MLDLQKGGNPPPPTLKLCPEIFFYFIVKRKNRVVFNEGNKSKRKMENLLTKTLSRTLFAHYSTRSRVLGKNQTKVSLRLAIRSNRKDRQPMRSSAPVSGIFHARKPTTAPLSFFLLTKRCFVGRKTL